jgi:hypothetical protein
MTFFARPNLSDEQFKQQTGTVLSLSGQTRITTTSGLTLSDGAGSNVIITAADANSHVGDVLTYDGAGTIKLLPASGAGGDPIYNPPYKSPAAVTLCGINAGFVLTGKTLSCILETMLVPTLNPSAPNPSNGFNIVPPNLFYEVGYQIVIQGNSTFDRGTISPVYCSGAQYRSGLPSAYNYTVYGLSQSVPSTSLSNTITFPNRIITPSTTNVLSNYVSYSSGLPVLNSAGGTYLAGLTAGYTTPAIQKVINGVYPWYWGKSATLPVAGQALINVGNKCVQENTNVIVVDSYNASGEYLWFAIPSTSSPKVSWQSSSSFTNCGTIPGDLFNSPTPPISINSLQGCWSGINYNFYISKYGTSTQTYSMTFKNTI